MMVIRGYKSLTIMLTGVGTSLQTVDLRAMGAAGGVSGRIRVRNTGSNVARLYFDNSTTYVIVPVGEVYSEPVEVSTFQVASATGTTSLEIQALCAPTGPPT